MKTTLAILAVFLTSVCGISASDSGKTFPFMVMKDVLKDIPPQDRREFVGNLWIEDGRIVTLGTAELKRTQSMDAVDDIIRTIAQTPLDRPMPPKRRFDIIALNKLVKDVPEKLQPEFLDNLMVKNCTLVSAYIGGLRKKMKETKIKEVLKAIFPLSDNASAPGDKIRCSEGICYDAVCAANPPASGPPYAAKPGWVCSASCGIY
ncbi:MAG: hypothetical protein WC421_06610 [Elusimicrobiales bacterium]